MQSRFTHTGQGVTPDPIKRSMLRGAFPIRVPAQARLLCTDSIQDGSQLLSTPRHSGLPPALRVLERVFIVFLMTRKLESRPPDGSPSHSSWLLNIKTMSFVLGRQYHIFTYEFSLASEHDSEHPLPRGREPKATLDQQVTYILSYLPSPSYSTCSDCQKREIKKT